MDANNMSDLLPYEGVSVDASQGIAEVNWSIIQEARCRGVGLIATGNMIFLGNAGTESLSEHPLTPDADYDDKNLETLF